jgi:hypothetical protein
VLDFSSSVIPVKLLLSYAGNKNPRSVIPMKVGIQFLIMDPQLSLSPHVFSGEHSGMTWGEDPRLIPGLTGERE